MLDQLLSPCNPGLNLVGFELDKIQVITFLPRKSRHSKDGSHRRTNGWRWRAAGIFQGLACPLQAVSHDIVPCLHYNVTPSLSTCCQNGMAR